MSFQFRSHWGYASRNRNPQSADEGKENVLKFKAGAVVARESPLLEDWRGKLLNFHLNPTPTGVAELDEVRRPIEMSCFGQLLTLPPFANNLGDTETPNEDQARDKEAPLFLPEPSEIRSPCAVFVSLRSAENPE